MPKKQSKEKKSIPHKLKFLLDANISRTIITPLSQQFFYDFRHICDYTNQVLTDRQIVDLAKKEKRVIITHDLDYGEIYYLQEQGKVGVIMLRLKNQTSAHVIEKLSLFFQDKHYEKVSLVNSLVIIAEEKIKIFQPK